MYFDLPVLRIYGNFTGAARSSVSLLLSVVLVSFFAAVDTSAERILTQVVPLQGRWRGLATLPLLLDDVIGRFNSCPDLVRFVDIAR